MARKLPKDHNRADVIICKHKFNLDEEVQYKIRDKYKTYKSILQLTQDVFEDPVLDENTDEFKNVKAFVARLANGTECIPLSEEQIEYIVNNAETMRPIEITRAIFPEIASPNKEVRWVAQLIKALDLQFKDEKDEDNFGKMLGAYAPPDKDHGVIKLINDNIVDANYSLQNLDADKRAKISFLKRNLNSDRFKSMCSLIRSADHRKVFVNEFVKATADKHDLSSEEINSYMNLSNEYVLSLIINEQIQDLNDRLKEATSEDEEGRKYTKALSDSLSTKTKEFDDCQKRMKGLTNDLNGIRSKKKEQDKSMRESLGKFIELSKSEKGREYMLKLMALRNSEIEKECRRIESLGDLAEVHGVSIEEILSY